MASLVSSVCWVNRGVAKSRPEKLTLQASDLENVINELKGTAAGLSADNDDESLPHKPAKNAAIHVDPASGDGESSGSELDEENEDPDDPYNLAAYDDDDQDEEQLLESTIAGMTVYADNKDDPYVTVPDEVDEEEDKEDFEIKPTDNLIVAGRAAPECSLLEVYVYNQKASNLYCHHDIILPAFPLATCWVNYDLETKSPGNLVAVGSMEPVISLWELDVVEVIEPVATLGTKASKSSKKKKKTAQDTPLSGHTDAVLDLSWHSLAPTALASASADHTAAIWDLAEGKQLLSLSHAEKVQTLAWHPKEASVLLTGAFDRVVRLFDCRQEDQSCMKWKIKGEVERVLWDQHNPFNFFASDDSGHIYYMDSRQTKPMFTLQAHTSAVTGITQCEGYNGCLVTVAMDSLLKVWDTSNQKPSCILEKKFKDQGGLTCVGTCPEANSVLVLGSEKCITIYDILDSNQVRRHFEKENITTNKKTDTVDEAMDGLNLNTMDSDEEEMNDYLDNIVETEKKGKSASKKPKQQNRKKKTAKRKNKQ